MSSEHEQASVAEFFERFGKAWDRNEAEEVAQLFTDDGTLINPFGQRADGRPAVTAMYSDYFAGMLAGTSTTFELQSVRSIDHSLALIDGEQTILAADGSVVLIAHLTALLQRLDDQWRFVDSRPYTFEQSPA